jgi:DNA-binding SARP family transcriptional activator
VVEIRLLGNVEIAGDMGVVRPRRSGERCVLAVLAYHATQPVTVATLVDHLWSGTEQSDKSIDTVGTYVRRVRTAITETGGQAGWLRYDRAARSCVLDIDPAWVDYHRFTTLTTLARQDHGPQALQEALALWRGPALADISGHWADHRRHTLQAERLSVYEDLLHHQLAAGQHAEVVRTVTDLVEDNTPTDQLLLLGAQGLAGSGQHTAIRAWVTWVTQLMLDTVDAAPSAAVLDEIGRLVAHPALWLPSRASAVTPVIFSLRANVPTTNGGDDEPRNPQGALRITHDVDGLVGAGTTAGDVDAAAHRFPDRLSDGNLSLESYGHAPGQTRLASGRAQDVRATRVATFDVLWDGRTTLPALLTMVNTSCDGILSRISQHDRCVVNTKRQMHSVQVSQVLRAEQDGADRWLLVYDWEVTTPDAPQIVGLRNCRLGRVVIDHEAHILVAEMVFHRPLTIGETLIMEYQVINPTRNYDATGDSYCRRARLPVRDYALEVQFDQDALPLRCQQVSAPLSNPWGAHRRDLMVSSTSSVHMVALGLGPGLIGISWSWPAGIPTLKNWNSQLTA